MQNEDDRDIHISTTNPNLLKEIFQEEILDKTTTLLEYIQSIATEENEILLTEISGILKHFYQTTKLWLNKDNYLIHKNQDGNEIQIKDTVFKDIVFLSETHVEYTYGTGQIKVDLTLGKTWYRIGPEYPNTDTYIYIDHPLLSEKLMQYFKDTTEILINFKQN